MPTTRATRANFDKFDQQTKWSGDLAYIERFNYFIGNASVNMSYAFRTEDHPSALLDALMQIEQCYLDIAVLLSNDTLEPTGLSIERVQKKLLSELPSAIVSFRNGNGLPLFELKQETKNVFLEVRFLAHKAGITIKQQAPYGDYQESLKKIVSGTGI